ncbi:hypothetical protein JM82_0924 [Olleya sp. Hel_I_94]|jgi:hypothetical protein|nr:hypothetical protein JM82_0924 [Olleya sp. Hel_I_94]
MLQFKGGLSKMIIVGFFYLLYIQGSKLINSITKEARFTHQIK